MKKVVFIISLIFALQNSFAQTLYFSGEWSILNQHNLFTGLFKIEIKNDGTAKAELLWTYLATDSTSHDMLDLYKGKKRMSGIEYATGNFSEATNDLYLEGTEKNDPHVILGLDKYHLKLAANKQFIYGSTETEGTNEGLIYAVKLNNTAGEKEFKAAKAKLKK